MLSHSTLTRGSRRARPETVLDGLGNQLADLGFGKPRALATRGTWKWAAAGVMCGSRPLADVVTRSTGIVRRRGSPPWSFSTSPWMRSISAFEVGPALLPDELAAL